MKVTQKRLAELLGVDRSTISKALADHPGISDDQKRRVRELCRELNYVPDYHGRTLSTGRTDILSITRGPLAMDEITASRLYHFQAVAEERGMRIRLDGFADALKSIHENSCDGVLVFQPPSLANSLDEAAKGRNTPVIFTDCSLRDGADTCVCPDCRGGATLATGHLVSLGHERIFFMGRVEGSVGCDDRYLGYMDALDRAGITSDPGFTLRFPDWPGDVTDMEAYTEDVRRALEVGCTAFVCSSDLIAAGVIRVLARDGVRVPQDVSVTGFDDSTIARVVFPSLTSVNQNFQVIAGAAMDLLHEILECGEAAEPRRSVACGLVVRESTAPVRAGR